MENKSMKNIIMLDNLPSNIAESAIVVLKNNKKIKKPELIKNNNSKKQIMSVNKPQDYVIKEAELVVQNCIMEIERNYLSKKTEKNLQTKYRKARLINHFLVSSLVISLVALIIK